MAVSIVSEQAHLERLLRNFLGHNAELERIQNDINYNASARNIGSGSFALENFLAEQKTRMEHEQRERFGSASSGTESLLALKANKAITHLAEQLPFAVLAKIQKVDCLPSAMGGPRCDVVFVGDRTLSLSMTDSFPTDADIARVCLEAP